MMGDIVVVAEKAPSSAVCYGECLESTGTLGTDRLFTGQRLDGTGLYYYGARYYDPAIGRLISADTIVLECRSYMGCNIPLTEAMTVQTTFTPGV